MSRNSILDRIRRNRPEGLAPLPEHISFARPQAELLSRFAELLRSIGGDMVEVPSLSELPAVLEQRFGATAAVLSYVPGLLLGDPEALSATDPHAFASIDLAVLPACFGVAENGAVWLREEDFGGHRALPFLTQHLVVTLKKTALVATMHEAYARSETVGTGFGMFLAGPSKTADIEQALVIGAHGARSLTVVVY